MEYAARHTQAVKSSAYVRGKVRAEAEVKIGELEIFGEIDELWGIGPQAVADALKDMGEVSEIRLKINSPGGWVFDGLAIYNLFKQHPASVVATVFGQAASAASVIAMAADRIIMAEGAMMMIHRSWGMAIGNVEDMVEMSIILSKIDKEMAGIYSRRTGNSKSKVLSWMEKETYFNGAEAVENGFAEESAGAGEGDESPAPEEEPPTPAPPAEESVEDKATAPLSFRARNLARLRLSGSTQAKAWSVHIS
jgi:ATP-dependent protease ClpP protease subunit